MPPKMSGNYTKHDLLNYPFFPPPQNLAYTAFLIIVHAKIFYRSNLFKGSNLFGRPNTLFLARLN